MSLSALLSERLCRQVLEQLAGRMRENHRELAGPHGGWRWTLNTIGFLVSISMELLDFASCKKIGHVWPSLKLHCFAHRHSPSNLCCR